MDNGASSYRRFLNGDDTGLLEIIKDYKDGLTLYLNSYVGNIYTAEELMEDTFFKLVTIKPRFSGKSTFKTWLYAIARNVAIDYIRHRSKLSDRAIEDCEAVLREEESVESAYFREERKILVHKALCKLKSEYRQILFLVYFEDFTNAQAAAVMKKSKHQIENLVYRARRALKSELDKEGFVYEEL